jgi:hypothetical protein
LLQGASIKHLGGTNEEGEMSRKQYISLVVLALVAGLAGGMVSSWFFSNQLVFAREATKKAAEISPELRVIMAREINLLGLDRKPRIKLAVDANGEPGLHYYDEKGRYRAGFSIGQGTPALTMRDKSGLRLQIGLTRLMSTEDEWPTILLMDKKGVERVILALDIEGRPHLALKNATGDNRVVLGYAALKQTQTGVIEKRPLSSLVLFNEKGNVIWQAP